MQVKIDQTIMISKLMERSIKKRKYPNILYYIE